jgi:hypothetical protein
MQSTCIAAGEGDYQIGGLVARIFRNQIIRFIAFTSFYLALTGTLCGFSSAQALSASAVDPKAALSPLVFDVSYFKSVNPAFAHLTDAQATSQWLNRGAAEGLRAHPLFWSKQYLAFYADLRAAFGATNYPAAIEHYVSTGHSEGREGVLALTPNVFDLSYYESVNPDVQSLSTVDAETFWIEHGIALNQHAHPRFFAPDYLFLNHDKELLFGPAGVLAAIDDFALTGSNPAPSGAPRIGIFSLAPWVFDPAYYMSRHAGLKSQDQAIGAWLSAGIKKGDKGSNLFSAVEYLAQYPDLQKVFDSQGYLGLLRHYVQFGRREGRRGLFAIDQSYLSKIPTSAGLTTKPGDTVEKFTSVTGKEVTVTIQAPAPNDKVYKAKISNPDTDFPAAVAAAMTEGAGTILVPRGTYAFKGTQVNCSSTGSCANWTINNPTDLIIDGQGSTLQFSALATWSILVNQPTRVLFKNFVIDWPNLPISALGTIIAGSTPGQNLLQMSSAFPFDPAKTIDAITDWNEKDNIFGRETATQRFWSGPASSPPVYQGNLIYSAPDFSAFPIGQSLLVDFYHGEANGFGVAGASDIAFENVIIHSVPGFAFFISGARGVRFSRCEISRSPGKLTSSGSDGIHFENVQGDVLIEDSTLSDELDDSINLAPETMVQPLHVAGTQIKIPSPEFPVSVGDPLMFSNSAWGLLGYATATTVSTNADGSVNVTLSNEVPHLATDSWQEDLNFMAPRWIIRNNVFHNGLGRAVLPQSPYGLLEDNVMSDMFHYPIFIGILQDVPPSATPGVQDLQVLNNQISTSGAKAGSAFVPGEVAGLPGAILIGTWLNNGLFDESGSTDVPVNQDIVLSGNSVRDVPGPAVFIGSASKVSVSGTQVEDSNRRAEHYFLGTASTAGSIVVSQTHDVTITGTEMTSEKTGPVSIDRHSTSKVKVEKRDR